MPVGRRYALTRTLRYRVSPNGFKHLALLAATSLEMLATQD